MEAEIHTFIQPAGGRGGNMIPKNVQMPNPNPKYKPPGTAGGGRGGNTMKMTLNEEIELLRNGKWFDKK